MLMKRLLSLMLLMSAVLSVHAQMNPHLDRYEVVGRNLVDNCDITAFKEIFDNEIYRTVFDSISNTALVTLWKRPDSENLKNSDYNSTIVYYDLAKQTVKWEKNVNLKNDVLEKMGTYIYHEKNDHSYLLDPETGKSKFKFEKNLHTVLFGAEEGWILCATYNDLFGHYGSVQKINLNTGELIWKKEANLDYGLKAHGVLHDSTVLFVGAGLRGVNVNKGSMWTLDIKTDESGYIDYKKKLYVGVYSNVLKEDSTAMYFAGGDRIVQLNVDGSLVWQYEFPSDMMSKSHIGLSKGYLVLVNHGFTYGSNYLVPIGEPFFSVFDRNTGARRYVCNCNKYTDFIIDAIEDDGYLYMLFQNKHSEQMISKFRMIDGMMIAKYILKAGEENFMGFVNSDIYVKRDSAFVRLNSIDTTDLCMYNKNGVVLFDQRLQPKGTFKEDDLYFYKDEYGGLRLFQHQDKIVLFDANDREVATLDFEKVLVAESELYSIKGNALYVMNKAQIPFVKEENETTEESDK